MKLKERRNPRKKIFSAETLMLETAKCLVSDFQDCLGDSGLFHEYQMALRVGNIPRIRESAPTPAINDADTALFKATYQLQNLLKRYRFRKDTYSENELVDKACEGFVATQDRLTALLERPHNTFYEAVLDTAAEYVAKVLGTYDVEEHRSVCRFGSGASVGVTSREACEAARWEWPITGSQEQISWFLEHIVQGNPHIHEYWRVRMDSRSSNEPEYEAFREIESLTLTLVPKSFKSLRSIVPNTTLGSFISDGLGRMIQRRLKRNGYDITKLQMQHRARACQASIHGNDVTLDLSSASDSLSVSLMKRLLPSDWFDVMSTTRIGKVLLPNGTLVEMETFCTMGVGYTFPLQTLCFLALLKATEKWTDSFRKRNWAHITVYGDDMIFDRGIYHNVGLLFGYVGLIINDDKSFSEGYFRESCGGDYHRGVDVRPFQPESGIARLGGNAYEALLYKFINGLRRRWSEQEIPRTLNYLVNQLGLLGTKINIVPPLHPDDSGIHVLTHHVLPEFLSGCKCVKPKHLGHGVFRFSYLRLSPELAKEERHEPYYWVALGGKASPDLIFDRRALARESAGDSTVCRRIDRLVGCDGENRGLLQENKKKVVLGAPKHFVGPPQQVRVDLSTYVTVRYTGTYTRQMGSSCFWDP